jgi:nucleoid DNA-binding protein
VTRALEEFLASLPGGKERAWDLLQHEGTPRRLAYEQMPALVELRSEPTLWKLVGLIGANADPGRMPPDVRVRFDRARERGEERLRVWLAAAPSDDEEALGMLSALSGVRGASEVHRVLQPLVDGCIVENRCPRCGALLEIRHEAGTVRVSWRAMEVPAIDGPWPAALGWLLGPPLPERHPGLARAIHRCFGPHRCPRCGDEHAVLTSRRGTSLRVHRQEVRGAAVSLPIPEGAGERMIGRLREIAASGGDDAVRWAGVGYLRIARYRPYAGRNPRTGEPVAVPGKLLIFFRSEDALDDLANDRAPPALVYPSDDQELDGWSLRVLHAFQEHDQVDIPDVGVLSVLEKRSRPGATVDGEPIEVPARRTVQLKPAPALLARLSP